MRLTALSAVMLAPALWAIPRVVRIEDIENSPALAVCTVEQITKLSSPKDVWPQPVPQWEVRLHVLRSYFASPSDVLRPDERLAIRFESILDQDTDSYLEEWPQFQTGQTAVVPLVRTRGAWGLVPREGINLMVPAAEIAPAFAAQPRNGRAFLLRELASAMANGNVRQRSRAADYFVTSVISVPPEFPALLENELGSDDDSWLEAGCAFLSRLQGGGGSVPLYPRRAAAPPFSSISDMVKWMLSKGATRDYPTRMIRGLLRASEENPNGAAAALLTFHSSPVLMNELSSALQGGAAGGICVAMMQEAYGAYSVLPEALGLAKELINHPASATDRQLGCAVQLLRAHDLDYPHNSVVPALRRFQSNDEEQYGKLWRAATGQSSRRTICIAAVAIDDCRAGPDRWRYCDMAANMVGRVSEQPIVIRRTMRPSAREPYVARSAEWLRTNESCSVRPIERRQ